MDVLALVLGHDPHPRQARGKHPLALGLGHLPLDPREVREAPQLHGQRLDVASEGRGQLLGHPTRVVDRLGPGIQPAVEHHEAIAEAPSQALRLEGLELLGGQRLPQTHLVVAAFEAGQERLAVDVQQVAQPLGHGGLVRDLPGVRADGGNLGGHRQLSAHGVVDRAAAHEQRHRGVVLLVRLGAVPAGVLALDPAQPAEEPAEQAQDEGRNDPHPTDVCPVPLHHVPFRAQATRPAPSSPAAPPPAASRTARGGCARLPPPSAPRACGSPPTWCPPAPGRGSSSSQSDLRGNGS